MRFVLVLSLTLASASAAAQSEEELAQARAQFAEGVQLLAEEQWEEAATRFRAVLAVRQTGQVRYNLAIALHRTGHLAEAAQHLTAAIADEGLERRPRRHARQLLDEIEPQLGRLRISVPADAAGASVTVDGAAVESVDEPLAVDPGQHRVALVRGSTTLTSRTVSVGPGETSEVSLEVGVLPSSSAVDPELLRERDTDRAPSGGGDVTGEWWFWTAIIGGVLIIAGVAIGIGVALTPPPQPEPVQGNLMPGILTVELP